MNLKKKKIKEKFKLLFYSISFLFLLTLVNHPYSKCSDLGIKLLDDVLGINKIVKICMKIENDKKEEIKKHITLVNINYENLRRTDIYSDVASKIKKDCGEDLPVILLIGQSNAANSVKSAISQNRKNLNYNPIDNFCYELTEPVLGATDNLYSITSSLGEKIKTDKTIIFLNMSVGGSTINDWEMFYANDVNIVLKKILKKNHLKSIIWMQGEGESLISSKNYFINFLVVKSLMFKNLDIEFTKTKLIITKSTFCDDKKNKDYLSFVKQMNYQRQEIKKKFPNTVLLEITDNLDNSFRRDNCHLNRKGTEVVTSALAKIINSTK